MLTCEDCDLREESTDVDALEDLAVMHRENTRTPLLPG